MHFHGTYSSDRAQEGSREWAAAAYSTLSTDNSVLGVVPMKSDHDNRSANHENAGTPENFKPYVIPGARGRGGRNFTGNYSGDADVN